MTRLLKMGAALLALCLSFPAIAGSKQLLTLNLDKIVSTDAQSWVFNRYDHGSTHNVRVLEHHGKSGLVYGEYTYNHGQRGWVKVRIANGQLSCLEFWDFQGICRDLGHSPSQALFAVTVAAIAISLAEGGSGGGGSSASDHAACVHACRDAPTPQGYAVEQTCIRDRCGGN